MTAPLHERLEALADETRLDAADMGGRGRHVRCRELLDHAAMLDEAAAALRPPESEVGALCERLENWRTNLLREEQALASHDAIGSANRCLMQASDLRAALAHLRRLAAVEVERDRDREVLAWLVDTLTEISFDGGDYDGANIQEDLTMLGVLHQTEYDPQRHGDNADCEPGDPYFEFTPYGKALIRVANEKRRALAPAPAAEPAP